MRQYFAFFILKFKMELQYRSAALAGIFTQFFFGFVFILVYMAFYESGTPENTMKFNELVSYLWLGQTFFALTYLYYRDDEILSLIRNGDIAYELCRPQNLYLKWYVKTLSSRLAKVLLRCFPIIIVSLLLPSPYNMSLPASINSLLVALISLIIGSFLVVSISLINHIITFYTLDDKGVMGMLAVIADLFSGGLVPVLFLPNFLKVISKYLPFQYIFDLPYRIYLGNIVLNDALFNIIVQLFWLVVLIMLGSLLTKHALKKVVVQGG